MIVAFAILAGINIFYLMIINYKLNRILRWLNDIDHETQQIKTRLAWVKKRQKKA